MNKLEKKPEEFSYWVTTVKPDYHHRSALVLLSLFLGPDSQTSRRSRLREDNT